MFRARLLLSLVLTTAVAAWAPPLHVLRFIGSRSNWKSHAVDDSGGTEVSYDAEADAQNLIAVRTEYAALAARVAAVMGSKPGGVAVSTEGRTWVELQVVALGIDVCGLTGVECS